MTTPHSRGALFIPRAVATLAWAMSGAITADALLLATALVAQPALLAFGTGPQSL